MSTGYYLPPGILPFQSYLARQFTEVLQSEEEMLAREAAEGAAFALAELGYRTSVPTELLTLLVARMVHRFGHSSRASEYLERHVEQRDFLPFYRGLIKNQDFDLRVWGLFDSHLVTSASWQTLNSNTKVWVLDLQSLSQDAALCYELAIFPSLKALLAELHPLGEETCGDFFIGLRGYTPRPGLPGSQEVLHFVRACLDQQRQRYGWANTPRACFLDLGL